MRRPLAPPVVAMLAAAALALTGCSDSSSTPGSTAERDATTSTSAQPTTSAAPSSSPPTQAPRPGSMDTPANSSGPLTQGAFPRPGRLGPQASYAVDPGDAEEGYAGNGTPALARDPQEVVLAAVPLGCARPDLPVPAHALEVDYAVAGTPVIAIRAEFAGATEAEQFFEQRAEAIRSCAGRTDSPAVGVLVGRVQPGRRSLVSERTPESDPWTEVALVDGRRVTLVAVRAPLGQGPAATTSLRRIQNAFQG